MIGGVHDRVVEQRAGAHLEHVDHAHGQRQHEHAQEQQHVQTREARCGGRGRVGTLRRTAILAILHDRLSAIRTSAGGIVSLVRLRASPADEGSALAWYTAPMSSEHTDRSEDVAARSWRWFWPVLILICAAGGRGALLHSGRASREQSLCPTTCAWMRRPTGTGPVASPADSGARSRRSSLLRCIRTCSARSGRLAEKWPRVYVVQILIDLLTAVLLALIGRARFGAGVGLLAAAAFLTLQEPASFCLRILTCSLQLLLVCLAWMGLLAVQKRDSLWRRVLAGAGVGLLSLAYPPAMLMVPVVGLWLWWRAHFRLRGLGRALVAVIAGAVVIMPATLHNYMASGELFIVQAASGITLRQGNGPRCDRRHRDDPRNGHRP